MPAVVKPGRAPAAQRAQGGQSSGGGSVGLSGVSVEKAIAVDKLRRKAQKAENVMHLVCWGPDVIALQFRHHIVEQNQRAVSIYDLCM
ncbi:hypothetical protein BAE44_0014396 [Dichanthelium oligosanthes]|uniref:Uncharacterized protein n=1 Tax=Dichanthelium oligosanthes TaxID=888268 RepID=A0A1E5VHN4_9POAL|nr:hypothetical protein BAE44_0014396 [Dichanthelium oligosanthes]